MFPDLAEVQTFEDCLFDAEACSLELRERATLPLSPEVLFDGSLCRGLPLQGEANQWPNS